MSNVGLLGLASGINERAAARQDLATLAVVEQQVQHDRDKEVLAQQQLAQEQEAFYNESSKLLEKDRNQINKRFMMHQSLISEKIKNYGGDRSKFMEAGGLLEIKKIKNQMTNSPEMVRYQTNQQNLAKILEAKAKGLGHLLSPTDIQSAENYNNSEEGGQITYSGVMSEVEIPPSANFDYGTEIPLANILSFKSNAMKVKNNYAMVYPDRPEPNSVELAAFAKKMGYGGQGSNTMKMKLAAEERAKRLKYENDKKKSNKNSSKTGKGKSEKYNALVEIVSFGSQLDKNITVKDLQGEGSKGAYMENFLNANPHLRNTVKNPNRLNGVVRNLDEKGFDFHTISSIGNNRLGLSNSYELLPNNQGDIAKTAFGNFTIEEGVIKNFKPNEKMYSADGTRLIGENSLEWDEYEGDYTIKGFYTGFKAGTSDSDVDSLVMDAYDNDGNIDEETSFERQENFKNSVLKPSTFLAVEDEDGNIFYREIDLNNQQERQTYDQDMGSDDDITSQVENEKSAHRRIERAHKMTEDEQLIFHDAIKTYDDKVFSDEMFYDEGSNYWGANTGSSLNRNPLMKAFYMASDYSINEKNGDPNTYPSSTTRLIDKNLFSSTAEISGITDMLKEYKQGNSDEAIIAEWLKGMNEEETEGSFKYNSNIKLASKWLQLAKLQKNQE